MRNLLWLAVLGLGLPAAAAEMEGRLRLEVGQEYDTNAQRVYGEHQADWLERFVLDGRGGLRSGAHWLEAAAQLGGKVFFQERPEDLLAVRISGTWNWAARPRLSLGADVGYSDNFMRVHDRDWRQWEGRALLSLRLAEWLCLEGWGGGRWFVFKPDDYQQYQMKLSHVGPLAGVRLLALGGPEMRAELFYEVQGAFFYTRAMRQIGDIIEWAGFDRQDLIHQLGLGICRRFKPWRDWRAALDVSWRVAATDSNSFGSSVIRHRLRLTAALQFPHDITLQFSGTLQFTSHPDGAYLEGNLYEPDADENENSLLIRLRVGIWDRLGVFLQGSIFRNAFNATEVEVPTFARETLGLGLYYEMEGEKK